MAANSHEEEIEIDELFQIMASAKDVAETEQKQVVSRTLLLNAPLNELVARIEAKDVQKVVMLIFLELTRLLEYLSSIEAALLKDKTLQQTLVLFDLINTRTSSLLRYIDSHTSQLHEIDEGLKDALSGTSFALNHELKRVFKLEIPNLSSSDGRLLSRADLTRAYGLLHNCFQQSTITLAQAFDSNLDGTILFSDYKAKVDQSFELYNELSLLHQRVSNAEKEEELLVRLSLINHVKSFRSGTMHYLMYRDWETFEGFVDELVKAFDNLEELTPVLHRFTQYLETLLKHVSMRADLSNQSTSNNPPAPIES